MAVQLNEMALEHAHTLINKGLIIHKKGEWEKDKPTPKDEDKFLANHTWEEYAKWFLGVDDEKNVENKERYTFPYGDFRRINQGGLIAILKRAAEYHHKDIKDAAQDLYHIIEKKHK